MTRIADSRVPSYRRCPVTFVRGDGAMLYDAAGREYLDFASGIGVNALGHVHPRLVEALRDQLGTLVHTSNLYDHPLQDELAAKLAAACALDLVFFCNSGTEAVEAALKMARHFQHLAGRERTAFLALENGFHGRTMGALSCTWEESYRAPFDPLVPAVDFVPPNDVDALEAALAKHRYAALIAEPIQGECGIRPLTGDYLRAARALTLEHDALLIFDEIQCGGGRTGEFLASQHAGVVADVVTLAKPIGGGLPIGATVAGLDVGGALTPGMHGSTFGGGALACRAGLVFLDELFERGLLERVRVLGKALADGLGRLVETHGSAVAARGRGLMQALVLNVPAAPIAAQLLEDGLLVIPTSGNVLRLLPPFIIDDADIEVALDLIDAALHVNAKQ